MDDELHLSYFVHIIAPSKWILTNGHKGKKKPIPLRLQDPAKSEKPEQIVKRKKSIRNLNLIRKLCQFMRARCFNVQFAIKSSIQK